MIHSKTMGRKTVLLFFLMMDCSNNTSEINAYFFIPMNYTGWVNIIYNDNDSSIESLTFKDGDVYFITGNPNEFRIKNDIFVSGKRNMHYYYYNLDTTIALDWKSYPKNIFFESTKVLERNDTTIQSFSFYVSQRPLYIDSVSEEKLLKNKLFSQ